MKVATTTKDKALPAVQEAKQELRFEGTSALTLMDNMDKLMKVGEFMVRSGLMPSTVKSAANAALIIWTGHELGLKPMVSIQFINIISGKPSLAPVMMRSLIIASGAEEIWEVRENTATVCTIYAKRSGGQEYTRSFTLEEASKIMSREDGKTIPLTQKFNWKNMPATMLLWRCTSAVCRVVYPDVINGMYITDEMEDANVAYDIEILPEAAQAESATETIIEAQSEQFAGEEVATEAVIHGEVELALTPANLKDIRARLKATKSDEVKFCAAIKVEKLENVLDSWHPELVTMLEKKRTKLEAEAKAAEPAAAATTAKATPSTPPANDSSSTGKSIADIIDFLKGAKINYTQEGDVINCGKSFKHKPALTSVGFTWDGDRQGFCYKAAA